MVFAWVAHYLKTKTPFSQTNENKCLFLLLFLLLLLLFSSLMCMREHKHCNSQNHRKKHLDLRRLPPYPHRHRVDWHRFSLHCLSLSLSLSLALMRWFGIFTIILGAVPVSYPCLTHVIMVSYLLYHVIIF